MIKQTESKTVPLYKKIQSIVIQWIKEGRYSPGEQLPSAREISKETGINEQTIRRALKQLIDQGTLRGAQGKGLFVSLTGTKHKRIALVLPNLEDELTMLIARAVQETLDKADMQTLILDAGRDSTKENYNIENLNSLPIDGAIIFPISYGNIAEHIISLKRSMLPFVLIDKHFHGISCDSILADDYGGAYALTEGLVKRGFRRFIWISGEENSTTVEDRLEGFRWALGDQGIPIARHQVRRLNLQSPTEDFHSRTAEEIEPLLQLPPETRPEVIVCSNDIIALKVLELINQSTLSVPKDIAVTGFDNSTASLNSDLTSVTKDSAQMGTVAAERLLDRLARKKTPPCIVLPTKPIFRKSTQRPA